MAAPPEGSFTVSSSPERLVLRPDAVEWRAVEGEVVALDVRRSLYLAINPSGAALWALVAEGTDREALVAQLRERFDVPVQRAEADADAFVAELRRHDLLA
jgi:hypothetical protein